MNGNDFTYPEAKELVKRLVDQFYEKHGKYGKNPDIIEAQLEETYIKPFFSYLNWNIHNTGLPNGREEFRVQTSHKYKKTISRPDYELWVPRSDQPDIVQRVLFMEAKNAKYDLSIQKNYIRQAFQYAHSSLSLSDYSYHRTRLSLLTDFEEFRLFDCIDPLPLQKDDVSLFNKYIVKPFDLRYTDYESEFDNIWAAFERNNVFDGSLNEFQVTDADLRKNRKAPDLRFIDDLKKWRLDLARSMYKSNKEVSDDFLTTASQILINRIIFLKMLTDREIEDDYLTQIIEAMANTKDESISVYESCRNIFEKLDKLYNGDIFKKREEFDYVKVENKIFIEIITALRPERSTYNLAAMPVEIIGNVYEDFLSEIIVHKGKGLSSEQKPDVQKAGGVYYTPSHIVKYIVENTVGEKLKKCKKPIDAAQIKILDPSCGSGSFLLGAYEYLIEWHEQYFRSRIDFDLKSGKSFEELRKKYVDDVKIYEMADSRYLLHLTSNLKKSILVNNIHGVDIDSNAVEIARFSLSMKALENATRQEIHEDVDLFNATILPKLSDNIKCGNTLIGNDYFESSGLFSESNSDAKKQHTLAEMKRIKPFDWDINYSNIIQYADKNNQHILKENFGFDCIIGNPPYVSYYSRQSVKDYEFENMLDYLKVHFDFTRSDVAGGRYNTVMFFMERATKLLKKNGLLSLIIDMNIHEKAFNGIRLWILKNTEVVTIINNIKAFIGVNSGQSIIVLGKRNNLNDSVKIFNTNFEDSIIYKQIDLIKSNTLKPIVSNSILDKLSCLSQVKESYVVSTGVNIGGVRDRFIFDKKADTNYYPFVSTEALQNGFETMTNRGEYIFYNHKLVDKINSDAKKHGSKNVIVLGNIDRFTRPKIFVRQTAPNIICTYSTKPEVSPYTIFVINSKKEHDQEYILKFLTGILNSDLVRYYAIKVEIVRSGEGKIPQIRKSGLDSIPLPKVIKEPDFPDTCKPFISIIDEMLFFKKEYQFSKTENEKNMLIEKIEKLYKEINNHVYKFYNLTSEEIDIIKSTTKSTV